MKLAHISDIHLGIDLNVFSLIEDQKFILDEMVEIFKEQKVDGVIIAGDVYDKNIASLEALRLFEDFLKKLVELELKVFIIAGNHDGAERLTFGRSFVEESGIYYSKAYDGNLEAVTLNDENGPVNIFLLPYLRQSVVKSCFPEQKIECVSDAVELAVSNIKINEAERNILVAHQTILNASRCDSEGIVIGGVDCVNADVFKDFDYVALGHLHGPQTLGTKKNVRYSGTPLKYSVSERNHKKSVTIIDFGKKGEVNISEVPLKPLRDLVQYKGTFAELIELSKSGSVSSDDYVDLILTDEEEILNAFYKLNTFYPHLVNMEYANLKGKNGINSPDIKKIKALNPLEMFERFYEERNGRKISDEKKEYIKELIEEIWEGEK